MRRLSKREKIIVSAGLLAAVFYVLVDYVVFPYWENLTSYSARIDVLTKRVISYRKILLGQDSVKAALVEAQRQKTTAESGLLTNSSEALANAEIQGAVKEMAAAKGLVLRRSDVLPVKSISSEYGKVSTRIEVIGRIDQLVDFLAAFETATPLLFVEEMRITPTTVGDAKQKQITATLQISGVKTMDGNTPPVSKKT
jgi:hypothetical protein